VLILTNRSWARDPYQPATKMRRNPIIYGTPSITSFDVQRHRTLTEEEVRQINLILKSRAYRYVAAAREEWLYPERYLVEVGLEAFDDYGRRPWQPDYRQGHEPQRVAPLPASR